VLNFLLIENLPPGAAEGAGMDGEVVHGRRPKRRVTRAGKGLRLKRIFARLREGASYDQIASEEGLTLRRVRQIVADRLEERPVDSETEHARLQLARLEPALKAAAEAIGAGDVRAVPAYLRVLERIDHYARTAVVNQKYDDEARQKLLDKLNQAAANLGYLPTEGPYAGLQEDPDESDVEADEEGYETETGDAPEASDGAKDGNEAPATAPAPASHPWPFVNFHQP
jgi:hypothetical protein